MGTYIKDNGPMTKQMDKEYTSIKMELNISGHGKMIFRTGTECKHGLTTLNIKEIMSMAKSKGEVFIIGPINPSTKGNGKTTKYTGMGYTNGLMVGNIKVNGFKIICKEKEYTLGRMEGSIKDNT